MAIVELSSVVFPTTLPTSARAPVPWALSNELETILWPSDLKKLGVNAAELMALCEDGNFWASFIFVRRKARPPCE